MTPLPPEALGPKIRAARLDQELDVRAAARKAGIARDTWKKIENGESVQDTKRVAALKLLGLDWDGEPVGGQSQDGSYVSSQGAAVESGITNEDLLREILRSRADSDRIAAKVEEHSESLRSVLGRLDRLESGS